MEDVLSAPAMLTRRACHRREGNGSLYTTARQHVDLYIVDKDVRGEEEYDEYSALGRGATGRPGRRTTGARRRGTAITVGSS